MPLRRLRADSTAARAQHSSRGGRARRVRAALQPLSARVPGVAQQMGSDPRVDRGIGAGVSSQRFVHVSCRPLSRPCAQRCRQTSLAAATPS